MAEENCVDTHTDDDFDDSLNNGSVLNQTESKEELNTHEDTKNEAESRDMDEDGNL